MSSSRAAISSMRFSCMSPPMTGSTPCLPCLPDPSHISGRCHAENPADPRDRLLAELALVGLGRALEPLHVDLAVLRRRIVGQPGAQHGDVVVVAEPRLGAMQREDVTPSGTGAVDQPQGVPKRLHVLAP